MKLLYLWDMIVQHCLGRGGRGRDAATATQMGDTLTSFESIVVWRGYSLAGASGHINNCRRLVVTSKNVDNMSSNLLPTWMITWLNYLNQ